MTSGRERKTGRTSDKAGSDSEPLPSPARQVAEQRLGVPLSTLRVHRNSPEPARHGARGLSRGNAIELSPRAGDETLGHELVHFAQGQLHGQASANGIDPGRTSAAEREADRLSHAVFSGGAGRLPVTQPRDAALHRDSDRSTMSPGAGAGLLFPRLQSSIAPQGAAAMSDDALASTAKSLQMLIALTPDGSTDRDAALANAQVIENEAMRRNLARWQLDDNAAEVAERPGGAPVVFAMDEDTGEIYASVTAAGATFADIATYVYGASGEAGALASANAALASVALPAGAPVKLIPGRQSAVAQAAIEAARKSGTLMRTKGLAQLGSADEIVYTIPLPSGVIQVNRAQFDQMIKSMRRRTRNLLKIRVESIEFLLRMRDEHEEETNSLVRGISDWSGDVSLPGQMRYILAIGRGNAVLAMLDSLEFAEDPTQTAAKLAAIDQMATEVMLEEARIEADFMSYIRGTISGAEKTVQRLETVRNVSFTVVAGMAGAVAAPAAFAALGTAGVTGTGATVLSIGAAGGTGALIRGGAEVVLPGAQADKPAVDRFKSGAWTGFVAGSTGGASSFLTPVASSAITGQLAQRTSQQFVQSTAGQVISRTSTGVVVGAPSGAVGSALENLPDVATGRMSGNDYLGSIGTGTWQGGLFGGAGANLPISGVSRASGVPFDFRSPAVVPKWTMAGPFNPIADIRNPVAGFNNLPRERLPAFADDPGVAGYVWARVRSGGVDEWVPVRSYGPKQEFELAGYTDPANPGTGFNYNLLYGPPGNPNALRLVGSRTIQTAQGQGYAGMQANDPFPGAPRSTRRDFPMTTDDFEVTLPDGTRQRMVRGHNVDFADTTPRTATTPDSNLDVRNFTPEPGAWGGLGGRNRLTMRIRSGGGGTEIRQINLYGRSNLVTATGKPVPEAIFLVEMGPNGVPARAWRVPFNDATAFQGVNMNNAAAIDAAFGVTNLGSVPTPVQIDIGSLPPGVAAMATLGLEEEPRP